MSRDSSAAAFRVAFLERNTMLRGQIPFERIMENQQLSCAHGDRGYANEMKTSNPFLKGPPVLEGPSSPAAP